MIVVWCWCCDCYVAVVVWLLLCGFCCAVVVEC